MSNFQMDDSKTLWQRWNRNAERNPDKEAIVHWVAGEEPVRWTYKNLIETAKKFSIRVKEAGNICF